MGDRLPEQDVNLYFWLVPRALLEEAYPDLDWADAPTRNVKWGLAVSCPLFTAAQVERLPSAPQVRLNAVLGRSWNLMVQARSGDRVRWSRIVASPPHKDGVGVPHGSIEGPVLEHVLQSLALPK